MPITKEDIMIEANIFGPNIGSAKTQNYNNPINHVHLKWQDISKDVMKKHWNVTLRNNGN